jgi:hypothetical protein
MNVEYFCKIFIPLPRQLSGDGRSLELHLQEMGSDPRWSLIEITESFRIKDIFNAMAMPGMSPISHPS